MEAGAEAVAESGVPPAADRSRDYDGIRKPDVFRLSSRPTNPLRGGLIDALGTCGTDPWIRGVRTEDHPGHSVTERRCKCRLLPSGCTARPARPLELGLLQALQDARVIAGAAQARQGLVAPLLLHFLRFRKASSPLDCRESVAPSELHASMAAAARTNLVRMIASIDRSTRIPPEAPLSTGDRSVPSAHTGLCRARRRS